MQRMPGDWCCNLHRVDFACLSKQHQRKKALGRLILTGPLATGPLRANSRPALHRPVYRAFATQLQWCSATNGLTSGLGRGSKDAALCECHTEIAHLQSCSAGSLKGTIKLSRKCDCMQILTEHVVHWADLAAHAYYMNRVTILTV